MSDLVRRLRDQSVIHWSDGEEAADRIEFLAASEHGLWGRLETCRQDEAKLKARIEQLEQELAVARGGLEAALSDSARFCIQLAAEKELADRLYAACMGTEYQDKLATWKAYSKARGL